MSDASVPTEIIIARIARLVGGMMTFWKSAHGWAPVAAAGLLNKSMLGWQTSLALCLKNWNRPLTDGELILAWANVGALVEGQLKLFLSVYYVDYIADVDAIKKKGKLVDPDVIRLEDLRIFFHKKVWPTNEALDKWILLVQRRRNAIHAFKAKSLGTTDELHSNLSVLLGLIHEINNRLPYPAQIYTPLDH